jgi:hypothetical protein
MAQYLSKYIRARREADRKEREAFADNLSRLLRKKLLRQSDVCRIMWPGQGATDSKGYFQQRGKDLLSAWCLGKSRPDPIHMDALCKALKVKVSDLWPDYDWSVGETYSPYISQPTAEKKRPIDFIETATDQYLVTSVNLPVDGWTLLKLCALITESNKKDADTSKAPQMSSLLQVLEKRIGKTHRISLRYNGAQS